MTQKSLDDRCMDAVCKRFASKEDVFAGGVLSLDMLRAIVKTVLETAATTVPSSEGIGGTS